MSASVSDRNGSAHDPMCIAYGNVSCRQCECDLIARVREDASGLSDEAIYMDGYVAALRDAAEAVKAALDAGLATSTDKALYFFEADKDDPTLGYDVTFHKDSLVAAIEALGGER